MELTVGIWRLVSKLRTEMQKQSDELRKRLDAADQNDSKDIFAITALVDKYRDAAFESKLAIVAKVDGLTSVENLTVEQVATRYEEIETEIIDKMLNRTKELPNE